MCILQEIRINIGVKECKIKERGFIINQSALAMGNVRVKEVFLPNSEST